MRAVAFGRPVIGRWFGVLGLALLIGSSARAAEPAELASYVSKDGLLAYVEFSGLDAHQAAWRKTAAHGLLNKTSLGAMLKEVVSQAIESGFAGAPPASKPSGAEVISFIEDLARSGFVLSVSGKIGSEKPSVILVVRNAPRASWDKALNTLGRMSGRLEQVKREDGRQVSTAHPTPDTSWAWWFEGKDLVIALTRPETAVDAVAETLAGKRPNAVGLPLRVELAKTVAGFEPVMISFLDLSSMPQAPPATGLSGLKRIDSRWGFQGEAMVSMVRVVAPKPRTGLLAMVDGPTFKSGGTLPVPANLTDFTVFTADPLKLFDQGTAVAKAINPNAAPQIDQVVAAIEGITGLKLREDILSQIGPEMAFFMTSDKVTIPLSPYQSLAQWFLHIPKITMIAEIKDPATFGKKLDALITVANRQIQAQLQNMGREGTVAFRPLRGGASGYDLDVPLGVFPLPSGIMPTIRIGKRHVAFSTDSEGAKQALAFEAEAGDKSPHANLSKSLEGLPKDLVMLNVSDPTEYVPELLTNIPFFVQALAMASAGDPSSPVKSLRLNIDRDKIPTPASMRSFLFPASSSVAVDDEGILFTSREAFPSVSVASGGPVMVALLLPAVQSARSAARRTQSVNNLKQIMLAYHNYHAANEVFPPSAISDGEGKPLLSWRVAILPYLEENALYQEFHLDEPWDSEHNKTLIERMPKVYASTNVQPKVPNTTFYQTFVGEGALNPKQGAKGTSINMITDGTSNSIAVVEAGEAVPWTKPDDIKFDPEKPSPKFGGPGFPGGFNAGFCDGSVRFLKNTINEDVLKALITIAGGEVINADDF